MVNSHAPQRGVSYLALLLAVAITSGALAAGATVWSQWQRREREVQLLWAGDQIRRAIVAYAQAGAESGAGFPRSLQDLLLDPRTPAPRRFLRQIYEDPLTRSTDWGLIRDPQGRLVGIYSRASGTPVKRARFAAAFADFEGASRYADWRFTAVALPAATVAKPAVPATAPANAGSGAVRAPDTAATGPLPSAAAATPQPHTQPQGDSEGDEPQALPEADPQDDAAAPQPP